VRLTRRFSWPGRLDPHERVWLTFAGMDRSAAVWLNGQFLGRLPNASEVSEFEVTSLLQPRDELTVEIEASETPGLWEEVALEVRCPAFLRGVRGWVTLESDGARLQVTGQVVGTSEGPLELYVLLDGATILYTPIATSAEGQAFHLEQAKVQLRPAPTEHLAKVELVQAATAWYTVEIPLVSPACGSADA
jgi:hypothetical protein